MENLLLYLLILYYTELRKLIPAVRSRRIDSKIRQFCDANAKLSELLTKAKKAANARKAMLRRNPSHGGIDRSRFNIQGKTKVKMNVSDHVDYVPCGQKKIGKQRQKDQNYIPRSQPNILHVLEKNK